MRLVLAGILILVIGVSFSQEPVPSQNFDQANNAFVEGDYDKAIEIYSSIIENNLESSELYFNLANSHYKKGNMAESILNYNKALLIEPGNKKYKENLKIVREKIGTDVIEISEFLPIRIWKNTALAFSPGTWLILLCLMAVLLFVSIYFWRFKSEGRRRMKFFLLTSVSLILFAITVALGYSSDQLKYYSDNAVVMKRTELRSGADIRADKLRPLVAGVTVKIIDRELDDWYKVSLRNKDEGWLERSLVEEI